MREGAESVDAVSAPAVVAGVGAFVVVVVAKASVPIAALERVDGVLRGECAVGVLVPPDTTGVVTCWLVTL